MKITPKKISQLQKVVEILTNRFNRLFMKPTEQLQFFEQQLFIANLDKDIQEQAYPYIKGQIFKFSSFIIPPLKPNSSCYITNW